MKVGHGPIGYYVFSSPEEAEREKQKHLAICNQCREDDGLPLLESSPYLSRTEFAALVAAGEFKRVMQK